MTIEKRNRKRIEIVACLGHEVQKEQRLASAGEWLEESTASNGTSRWSVWFERGIELRKHGSNLIGLCPFHAPDDALWEYR